MSEFGASGGKVNVVDCVAELTRPYSSRSHYVLRRQGTVYNQVHLVKAPSLIAQLMLTPPRATGEVGAGGYESRPLARVEALDCLRAIDRGCGEWLKRLDQPLTVDYAKPVPAVAQLVRRLHAASVSCEAELRDQVEHDLRVWWARARTVTGWDDPPWRPDATCPACNDRATLRVRPAEQTASCVSCGAAWDPETIGLLADHIRGESIAGRRPAPAPDPCWCPLPHPAPDPWPSPCPRCASPYCHHAVEADTPSSPGTLDRPPVDGASSVPLAEVCPDLGP